MRDGHERNCLLHSLLREESVKTLRWRLQKHKKLAEEGGTLSKYGVGFPWKKTTRIIMMIGQKLNNK